MILLRRCVLSILVLGPLVVISVERFVSLPGGLAKLVVARLIYHLRGLGSHGAKMAVGRW